MTLVRKVSCIAVLLATTAPPALAGRKLTYPVEVSTIDGGITGSAGGAIGSVRNSADGDQLLEVSVSDFGDGSWAQFSVNGPENEYGLCATNNPLMVAAARSVGEGSYVWFSWNETGTCTMVYVFNGSTLEPKLR
jgi:hypothetical protein